MSEQSHRAHTHPRAISPAVVWYRQLVRHIEPLDERGAITDVGIRTANLAHKFHKPGRRMRMVLRQPLGIGQSHHRVIREMAGCLKEREILPLDVVELIRRAHDVSDYRTDHISVLFLLSFPNHSYPLYYTIRTRDSYTKQSEI